MEQPCHHGYTQAPYISPFVCAVCFTEACIGEMKTAQAAFTRRGGIFGSPNAEPDWYVSGSNVKDMMTHRDWAKLWRKTRLKCCRLVAILEKLRDERSDMVEEWGVDEALYIWEVAKDECSRVPGCGHVEDSTSLGEQETLQSHDTQAFLKPAHKGKGSSEGNWETVERRSKKRSQPLKTSRQDEPERTDIHEAILRKTEGVKSKLKYTGFTLENRFEALAIVIKKVTTNVAEPTEKPTRIVDSDTTPVTTDSFQEAVSRKPRSALKITSPSLSQPRKHVIIDAQATILPSDITAATTMPHHEHTIADNKHTQLSYNRKSRFYIPSCWASPEGYKKENTSFHKYTWETVDRLQREFETSKDLLEEGIKERDEVPAEKAKEKGIPKHPSQILLQP